MDLVSVTSEHRSAECGSKGKSGKSISKKRPSGLPKTASTTSPDVAALYSELIDIKGKYTVCDLIKDIQAEGINIFKDVRLTEIAEEIKYFDEEVAIDGKIDLNFFNSVVTMNKDIMFRALSKNLAIPNFQSFVKIVELLYTVIRFNYGGQVMLLPPQMIPNKEEWWGIAFFSIDGQKIEFGHSYLPLILQAINKVWLYGLALEILGHQKVHQYVGVEYAKTYPPEVILNKEGKPHNAFSYAGCLVICSLLICMALKQCSMAQKFEKYLTYMKSLSCKKKLYFNNTLLLLERDKAYEMRAITYFLKANGCFPENCDVEELLEFYYQTNAIEVTCEELALMGATLANDGINPITNKQIYTRQNNKCLLSVMRMCGIYNYSEEFFLKVGLPVKSSKTGQILFIIPGQLSCALYSPAVDEQEISVRSKEFCRALAMEYSAHPYDHDTYIRIRAAPETKESKMSRMAKSSSLSAKKTVRKCSELENTTELCPIMCAFFAAAARGDVTMVAKLAEAGYKLCAKDYMQRTILHVAASRGYMDLVRYILLKCPTIVDWKDCMGCTASENAYYFGHTEVYEMLDNWESVKKLCPDVGQSTTNYQTDARQSTQSNRQTDARQSQANCQTDARQSMQSNRQTDARQSTQSNRQTDTRQSYANCQTDARQSTQSNRQTDTRQSYANCETDARQSTQSNRQTDTRQSHANCRTDARQSTASRHTDARQSTTNRSK